MERAASNPEIKWILVSLHRTPYWGEAVAPNDKAGNEKIGSVIQQTYHPLFDQYGVDLVLAGHEHNYQRTYPLKYNGPTSEPTLTSLDKENYKDPENPIFLTIGTGGVTKLSVEVDAVDADKLPKFIVSTNGEKNTKGVLELTFTKDNTLLEATFRSNDGNTLDRFTISKNVDLSALMLVPAE